MNGFAPTGPGASHDGAENGVKGENGVETSPVGNGLNSTGEGTSSNVSPLSSTLSASLPYSGSVSATTGLHPSYATATSTASAYDTGAYAYASAYAPYGAPHVPSSLAGMDPYSAAYAGSASNPTNPAFQVSQKF